MGIPDVFSEPLLELPWAEVEERRQKRNGEVVQVASI